MMWYGGIGMAGMIFGSVMMVLFWGAIIVLAVWAIRSFSARPNSGQDGALDILKRRLASGEINQSDYEQARKALQG